MVEMLVSVLKEGWRLTSPLAWLALLAVGLVLLYVRRTPIWGRRWLTAVVAAYAILSIPIGAAVLSFPLTVGQSRLTAREQAPGASAVVVLGGGIVSHVADGMALDDLMASGLRVIEGVRVYKLLNDPLLIVSGGNTQSLDPSRPEAAAFHDASVRLGVPPSRILVDAESMTTHAQAVIMKRVLAERGIDRFVLVTSRLHMSRSLRVFRASGLKPIPSASAEGDGPSWWTLVPDRKSLQRSDAAVYEYAAWLYYWWRGWLRHPAA